MSALIEELGQADRALILRVDRRVLNFLHAALNDAIEGVEQAPAMTRWVNRDYQEALRHIAAALPPGAPDVMASDIIRAAEDEDLAAIADDRMRRDRASVE